MTYERKPKELKQADILKAFEHAEREYPNECCGVFTRSIGYFPCTNIHEHPQDHFKMKEFVQLAANAEDVIAVFHSHPSGPARPTNIDMECQIQNDVCWGIASMNHKGKVEDCFFWGSDNIPPLLGRKYRSGSNDCYSIIRDAYKLWYDVDLPEFARGQDFWNEGKDLYMEGFNEAGFRKIEQTELMPGDVLLGTVLGKGIVNHGAVVLNDKEIIHHLNCKLSRRDSLTRWFRNLNICLRYVAFDKDGGPKHPPKLD